MRASCTVLILCITGAARGALPEDASDAGETAFRQGRDALKQGRLDEACAHFAESHRLAPEHAGSLMNLADCEQRRSHWLEARRVFLEALARLSADDRRREAVEMRLHALDEAMPRLMFRWMPVEFGMLVTLDGRSLTKDGEVVVDPGEHVVLVEAAGRRTRVVPLQVGPHAKITLTLEPGEPIPSEGRDILAQTPAPRARPIWPLAIAGAGALVAGVGVVTRFMADDKSDTYDAHCDASGACDAEGLRAARTGKTLSWISTGSLAAGGALVVGGIALWLFHKPAPISVTATPEGAWASWQGRF